MHNIRCLNKISSKGTDIFGSEYTISDSMDKPDGILVRSASMHGTDLPGTLLAIARAGAGVNNIPVQSCSESGIVVFNTPGANANAVKELVIAAMLMISRRLMPAANWVNTLKGSDSDISKLVEKGKSAFAGPELLGKRLGVIGLGAIGVLVANAAQKLGMEVYGYDPFLSVDAAWHLSSSIIKADKLDELLSGCDYVTIHVPLNSSTRGMLNNRALSAMKPGARLLNFSRGELVDADALLQQLQIGHIAAYATDFPTDAMLQAENVLALPHLGASTPESEDNCAVMAAQQLKNYLENGCIVNSVNFPELEMPRDGYPRICIAHRNIPNAISAFAATCGEENINIENMLSKSRGEWAYTILDVSGNVTPELIKKLSELTPVVRARYIA